MSSPFLRQAIAISILGHITLFSTFSLSFGPKVSASNFARVYFWGGILRTSDLMSSHILGVRNMGIGFLGKSEILALDRINQKNLLSNGGHFTDGKGSGYVQYNNRFEKPLVSLAFNQEKIVLIREANTLSFMPAKKEPAIMFYPKLPYHFALYFKDRQNVHIELMFQSISGYKRNYVLVKRRVSSGNLEADLLSVRYISRYLFIKQRNFSPNKWQTVKIDLSTIND